MRQDYLKQMAESGYSHENIDAFHRLCLPYLGERFFPDKGARILDVGAGHGHCLFPLKDSGYENLNAADIDDYNRALFEENAIAFHQVDAERQEFPLAADALDVVLAFHLIEHLTDPSNLLAEARRMLRPDGLCILVTPDWRKQYKTFYHDPTHVRPYDKVSVARLLRGFDFELVFVKSFGAMRGLGATGLWKVIKPLMFTGNSLIAISRKRRPA